MSDGEPFFVRRAKGCRIWDVDGREMIDYVGTWGPAILGHAPRLVIEAIHDAAKDGVSFGIPNPYEVEMARLICDWVPSIEKVRMVNSGTEATMSAIRLARGFTGRDRIVKFARLLPRPCRFAARRRRQRRAHPRPARQRRRARGFRRADHRPALQRCRSAARELFAERWRRDRRRHRRAYPANAGLILASRGFLNCCAISPQNTARCSSSTKS